jgi:beta-glucosidase
MGARFPDGFLWGTATSAHQVEGGNWNNDWWVWEHVPASPCIEPSGDACDHYHRYPADVALLAGLGFGAYRFSVEWSRIEPEEGEFSAAALEHYARMAETCREAGLAPIVTLHHFTTPRWVAAAGGWAEPATAARFERFAGLAAGRLGPLVERFCTINEPNVVATMGFLTGIFPPGVRDPAQRERAARVLADAHRRAMVTIREVCDTPAGLTVAMTDYRAEDGAGEILALLRDSDEEPFLEAAEGDDFIGVQTYTRNRVAPSGPLGPPEGAEITLMGYEFFPEAIGNTVRRAHEVTGLPVLVTENGVAVADDARRIAFIRRALEAVHGCITDGIPVEGYCYWSAMDNFEWAFGYAPTFGLIAVDRATQARTPKPSASWLGAVARDGGLPD